MSQSPASHWPLSLLLIGHLIARKEELCPVTDQKTINFILTINKLIKIELSNRCFMLSSNMAF